MVWNLGGHGMIFLVFFVLLFPYSFCIKKSLKDFVALFTVSFDRLRVPTITWGRGLKYLYVSDLFGIQHIYLRAWNPANKKSTIFIWLSFHSALTYFPYSNTRNCLNRIVLLIVYFLFKLKYLLIKKNRLSSYVEKADWGQCQ